MVGAVVDSCELKIGVVKGAIGDVEYDRIDVALEDVVAGAGLS